MCWHLPCSFMSADPNYRADAVLELRRQRPSRARCVPGVTGAGLGWAALLGLGGSGTVQPLCCRACPASGTWVSRGDAASGRGACLCPPAALPAALGAYWSWARCSQVSAIEGWCRSWVQAA